ncbi:MAG TPA: response regulator transcription factor [Bacteroidota bacterium]|nr:response regulator transcription factor [Bacteroidota bacterium]
MSISVAIVEDNASIRDGIARLLNATPGFRCNQKYASCEEALQSIKEPLPDIVLMDIGLDGMSGIEGVRRLKQRYPNLNVVMLTVYDDNERIFQSLCSGASGYLLKNSSPEVVMAALTEVHRGGAAMTPSIAKKVLSLFRSIAPAQTESHNLTKRETEILEHLVAGSSYKMIADALNLSIETVHTHIKRIYGKLQVHSKTEAVSKALRQRLV